eukprot:c42453_g1_i1 orf=411-719(+)
MMTMLMFSSYAYASTSDGETVRKHFLGFSDGKQEEFRVHREAGSAEKLMIPKMCVLVIREADVKEKVMCREGVGHGNQSDNFMPVLCVCRQGPKHRALSLSH